MTRAMVEEQKPILSIVGPPCTAYSSWQKVNDPKRDPTVVRREKTRAAVHRNFACELYQAQREGGGYFLPEHPLHASSWEMDAIKKLLREPDVMKAEADQ